MQDVELGQADFAESLAERVMHSQDRNGAVLKGFVSHACGNEDLLAWAEKFCSDGGESVQDQLCYYEGFQAKPGESFSQQLQRQLEEDFREFGSPTVVNALFKLLQRSMQLHESCREASSQEGLRWRINIEVNVDGACTKYHDDLVEVRFAMTLAGEGTVLAQQSQADWHFYESCEGLIAALQDEDLDPSQASSIIQAWNQRICKSEVATQPGDLVVMKGGKLTKRPCLHRAPYCAGEGMQPTRLLITLEHIPRDELQTFADMDFGDADVDRHTDDARTQASGDLLPVTVLSGFLGAGKTSLLTHVLNSDHGLRVAVIVNDMAEVNIDAMLVKSGAKILTSEDKMIEMQNGCICCTLRGDLIEHVSKLAEENRFDYLLIESTGISEPMPVATTFVTEHDGKKLLGSVARLDTLVTVVDGKNFLKDFGEGQRLIDRPALGAEETDERTLAHLLTDQVECANLILLNKTDLIEERDAARLEEILKRLNPKAKIIRSSFGKVDVKLLLNSCSFDMAEAEQMPGWYQELLGNHVPETQEYNISSFVFRAQRPFHPGRLDELLRTGFDGVLRSKGLLWVAGLGAIGLCWSQAGETTSLDPGAAWLHGSADPSLWPPDTPQEYRSLPYGDRRQEVVFIGKDLKEAAVRKLLQHALVTDAEFQLGSGGWAQWPNPFAHMEPKQHTHKRKRVIKGKTFQKNKSAAKRAAAKKKPAAKAAVARRKTAASTMAAGVRRGLNRKAA